MVLLRSNTVCALRGDVCTSKMLKPARSTQVESVDGMKRRRCRGGSICIHMSRNLLWPKLSRFGVRIESTPPGFSAEYVRSSTLIGSYTCSMTCCIVIAS